MKGAFSIPFMEKQRQRGGGGTGHRATSCCTQMTSPWSERPSNLETGIKRLSQLIGMRFCLAAGSASDSIVPKRPSFCGQTRMYLQKPRDRTSGVEVTDVSEREDNGGRSKIKKQ